LQSRVCSAVVAITRSASAPRQLFLPIATIIFAGCRQG
jgi:hypothetical protein